MKILSKVYRQTKRKEIILVSSQFIVLILHLVNFIGLHSSFLFKTNIYKNSIGIFIIIMGIIGILLSVKDLGNNISPLPSPVKNSSLVTKGIYKLIGHPMYYSAIIISIGIFVRYLNFLDRNLY